MQLSKVRAAQFLVLSLLLLVVTPAFAQLRVIPCTQNDLRAAVAEANQNGGGRITFACQDTTIFLNPGLGDIQNNVIIDGEGNNITLAYAGPFVGCRDTGAPCSAVGPQGDAECGGGAGSCVACDQGNNFSASALTGPPIAKLQGSGNVFRNIHFLNWLESLQILGSGNTIENSVFEAHFCSDDGLSTPGTNPTSTVVRNNKFLLYMDKAFQMDRGGVLVDGNLFTNCKQPIRINNDGSGQPGTFTIVNNIFTWTEGVFLFNEDPIQNCSGPRFTKNAIIRFDNNIVDCFRGLRLGDPGDMNDVLQITMNGNTIIPHGGLRENRVGLRISGAVVASLSNNLIYNNGRNAGSLAAGGVIVQDQAQVDLGGGSLTIGGNQVSSSGGNTIIGNYSNNEFLGKDVRNFRSGFELKAENNCWDGQSAGEIANDIDDVNDNAAWGTVDFQPFAASCTSGARLGPTITPLSPTDDQICVQENQDINILVQDWEDQIDQGSISVEVNGSFVSPNLTGSGASVTLRLPPPIGVPPNGKVTVTVTASDTAAQPNVTSKTYTFCIRPPVVDGVLAG